MPMKKTIEIKKDEKGFGTLYVNDEPFLILGGELHNSSSSNLQYMEKQVWPRLKELNLNTVLLPVAWENIEKEEGVYDFSLLEELIFQARREKMKLILLWFGLWKNGESTYVPGWVKRDSGRFFRARYKGGELSQTISPLCKNAVKADARAFTVFMKKLKDIDAESQTVLMVQVENEIGFLKSDRDYSKEAEKQFRSNIPEELEKIYGISGTWSEVFQSDAAEMFMAWNYAQAVEYIAAAGKRAYELPMYVNAWLNQFPDRPGNYPSGGPIARNKKIWRNIAKSIDVFAPDIYLSDFEGVCKEYATEGNPLFIPEARRDPVTASNAFYTFGKYGAIGFSPFGIEGLMEDTRQKQDKELLEQLQIDVLAFTSIETGKYLKETYKILKNMQKLYFRFKGTENIHAFMCRNEHERGTIVSLSGCDLELTYRPKGNERPGCAGMIIEENESEFWAVGYNTDIRLLPKKSSHDCITIICLEEGFFDNGKWSSGRVLNGDERSMSGFGQYAEVRHYIYCKETTDEKEG